MQGEPRRGSSRDIELRSDDGPDPTFNGRRRVRKFFGKIPEVAEMPNLIEVQKASYDQFLMVDEPEGGRPDEGLQAVFKSVFPISRLLRLRRCSNSCVRVRSSRNTTSTNAVSAT